MTEQESDEVVVLFQTDKALSEVPVVKLDDEGDGQPILIDDTDRCPQCDQLLSQVKMRPSSFPTSLKLSSEFSSESEALISSNLIKEKADVVDVSSLLLTHFCFYDSNEHMVGLDGGLVESGKSVWGSGVLMAIDTQECMESTKGLGVLSIGPIVSWWVSGYHEEERLVFGVSTATADYYLCKSDPIFKPYMDKLTTRAKMAKALIQIVVRSVLNKLDLEYSDLIDAFEMDTEYNEEQLLLNAQPVLTQIFLFEAEADEDEIHVLRARSLRHLIDKAGLTSKMRQLSAEYRRRHRQGPHEVHQRTVARDNVECRRGAEHPGDVEETEKSHTTPLVSYVFESFFADVMKRHNKDLKRMNKRCGICKPCLTPDCGQCHDCRQMSKYNGQGDSASRTCVRRRCVSLIATSDIDVVDEVIRSSKRRRLEDLAHKIVHFPSPPICKAKGEVEYFDMVTINAYDYRPGDYVFVNPDLDCMAMLVCRILQVFTDNKAKLCHVQHLCRATDTVLGETADVHELFLLDECEDVELREVVRKVDVTFCPITNTDMWREEGGSKHFLKSFVDVDDVDAFFFRLTYKPREGRFEAVSSHVDQPGVKCHVCPKLKVKHLNSFPRTIGETIGVSLSKRKLYSGFNYRGSKFVVGDAVFLSPAAIPFERSRARFMSVAPAKNTINVDNEVYTEYHRHKSSRKNTNEQTPAPYPVGIVNEIYGDDHGIVHLEVVVFVRPENTCMEKKEFERCELNLLFLTNTKEIVRAEWVEGKCHIRHRDQLRGREDEWFESGRGKHFVVEHLYIDPVFQPLHKEHISFLNLHTRTTTTTTTTTTARRPLRSLDVFSGCGGLSLGLEQSGVARCAFAIEKDVDASKAFAANFRECKVICSDVNEVLVNLLEGRTNQSSQVLPSKSQVELLCGGPPCQGFSHMNVFSATTQSHLKNSLVATYLSFCDYFRPRFCVMENVQNFVNAGTSKNFSKGLMLKLCLRALVLMGYQVTFGTLQAGHHGLPQSRRRFFILAAAPNEKLPNLPLPVHVFTKMNLNVHVDNRVYVGNHGQSAALRTTTVGDAIADLPTIDTRKKDEDAMMVYGSRALSHYQRLMRCRGRHRASCLLRDHVCKAMTPLMAKRIELVPKTPGSDWRDLPNIVTRLSDGSLTERLKYRFRSKEGILTGVCACAQNPDQEPQEARKKRSCGPTGNGTNTIIPWWLPHKADQHNQYVGVYGRLAMEDYFPTTITTNAPTNKQGCVLHPLEDRLLSVRECARSQGFPDHFQFDGNIAKRHCQIGNAVPPPLAKALGLQIADAVWAPNDDDINDNDINDDNEVTIISDP